MRDRLITAYFRGSEHPGKLRLVRALSRLLKTSGGVVAPVGAELRLRLDPSDWIEYLLLRGEPYEPSTLSLMTANLMPGDGAVLAGVNFGLHVAVAARAVSETGIVVGVEPQPAALLRARFNLDLNGLAARVRLVAAALGQSEELVPMAWSDPDNAGAASLLDHGLGVTVPILRLDRVLPLLEGRSFRLLLLDVQGYELDVLAGAPLTPGPDLIIVELDPTFLSRRKVRPVQVSQTLEAAGYQLFDVTGSPARDRLTELPERNLVAVRAGARVRWLDAPK